MISSKKSFLFSNVGKKIKTVAVVFCWIGIIAAVLAGLAMIGVGLLMSDLEDKIAMILGGIGVALVGSVMSWLGSLVIYGFGELVDNSTIQTRLALKKAKEE